MKKTELSNLQIVVVAVARLSGKTQSIHTEDVAVEAYKLAPGHFAWRKYPNHIDLESVRRTLTNAALKSSPLVVGSVRRGWMLSKYGIQWIEKNTQNLPALSGYRRGSVSDAIEIEKIRLRETRAWQKFKSGLTDQIKLNDLFEFARVNEYFSDAKRRERFNIVASAVDGDPELAQLWQLLQQRFPNEMEKQNE
jgi:hypothetical protein